MVTLNLTNASLAEVLEAVVQGADHPVKYSIVDYAIIFSPKIAGEDSLFDRTFRLDDTTVQTFRASPIMDLLSLNIKNYCRTLGINLDAPGRTVFFSFRFSLLTIRATQAELDKIGLALDVLSNPAATNTPLVDHTFQLEATTVKKMMDAAGLNYLTEAQYYTLERPSFASSEPGGAARTTAAASSWSIVRGVVEGKHQKLQHQPGHQS